MTEFPFGLLPLQVRDGLLFWPVEDVALILDEVAGRVTVVAADGQVAHRPGPLGELQHGPWVRLEAGTLGNPRLARHDGDSLVFPGGWRAPAAPQPPPRKPKPHPTASVAGLDPHDVRSVRREGAYWRVGLAGGKTVRLTAHEAAALAAGFTLPHLDHLEPTNDTCRILYQENLRDWPQELVRTAVDVLRPLLGSDERMLIANVIWQAVRWRAQGHPLDYGWDHRGFWYRAILPLLARLGFVRAGPDDVEALAHGMGDAHYLRYESILADLVGDRRLLCYRDLGFEEPRPDLRGIGSTRPAVILAGEKNSLLHTVRAVAEQFGVSWVVMGGQPSYLATEFFAAALQIAGVTAARLVALTDFDPEGWTIPRSLARHLDRYGIAVETDVAFLVRPQRFTAEEIALLAQPIPETDPTVATKIREWLEASGGIDGRAMRIHADHLHPVDRVVQAFREETGLEAMAGG